METENELEEERKLSKVRLLRIDHYIRITLSELVDQQFKIGNVLKYLTIVISYV
jgi:hypothetical protein